MARITPTTIAPSQPLTINLQTDPALTSRTTALIRRSSGQTVTTVADSVEASRILEQLQQMRRWVQGIYHDAKAPLGAAKKTLDAQERALLEPLATAEQRMMALVLGFQGQQRAARMQQDAQCVDALLAGDEAVLPVPVPVEATVVAGMQTRTTYTAEVVDLKGLVLAVAAGYLLELPGVTKVTRRWLTEVCQPTPQATLDLLQPTMPAVNRLARALQTDLAVPGIVASPTTTLVAR
jgi:hypothetical protein